MIIKKIYGHALIIIGGAIAFYVGGCLFAYNGTMNCISGVHKMDWMLLGKGFLQVIFSGTVAFCSSIWLIYPGSKIIKDSNNAYL